MFSSDLILNIANLLQASLAGLTLFAVLPQWLEIRNNKSSANISLASWVVWSLASLVSVFYSSCQVYFIGSGHALLLTTTVSLLCNVYTVYLIIAFGKKAKASASTNAATTSSSLSLLEILNRIEEEVEYSNIAYSSAGKGSEARQEQVYH